MVDPNDGEGMTPWLSSILAVRGDAVGTAADWVGALERIRGKVGVVTDLTPNCLQPNTR